LYYDNNFLKRVGVSNAEKPISKARLAGFCVT
jgi:hypothetical protein